MGVPIFYYPQYEWKLKGRSSGFLAPTLATFDDLPFKPTTFLLIEISGARLYSASLLSPTNCSLSAFSGKEYTGLDKISKTNDITLGLESDFVDNGHLSGSKAKVGHVRHISAFRSFSGFFTFFSLSIILNMIIL
jgi:lipopolysaccharide assembly outer membrane protein LptD (OstA)